MCPLTFLTKSEMQIHSKSHTEAKPHKCPHCSKTFANASYLSQHLRIHLGIKPYHCSYCENSFRQLSHLQQHTRSVQLCTQSREVNVKNSRHRATANTLFAFSQLYCTWTTEFSWCTEFNVDSLWSVIDCAFVTESTLAIGLINVLIPDVKRLLPSCLTSRSVHCCYYKNC